MLVSKCEQCKVQSSCECPIVPQFGVNAIFPTWVAGYHETGLENNQVCRYNIVLVHNNDAWIMDIIVLK